MFRDVRGLRVLEFATIPLNLLPTRSGPYVAMRLAVQSQRPQHP